MIQRALKSTIKALLLTIETDNPIKIGSRFTAQLKDGPEERVAFFFKEACDLARTAGLSEGAMVDAVIGEWSRTNAGDTKDKLIDTQEALDFIKADHLN